MTYSFDCKTCGACGCGVSLFDADGKNVTKKKFMEKPQVLYCQSHVPVKPKVTVKVTH